MGPTRASSGHLPRLPRHVAGGTKTSTPPTHTPENAPSSWEHKGIRGISETGIPSSWANRVSNLSRRDSVIPYRPRAHETRLQATRRDDHRIPPSAATHLGSLAQYTLHRTHSHRERQMRSYSFPLQTETSRAESRSTSAARTSRIARIMASRGGWGWGMGARHHKPLIASPSECLGIAQQPDALKR